MTTQHHGSSSLEQQDGRTLEHHASRTLEHQASRTLVKSPPELWAECSDAASLARHIGEFGEIRITRLEPETSVVWEGECANGTVQIEPSGWGTRVTLTAQTNADRVAEEVAQEGISAQTDTSAVVDETTSQDEAAATVDEATDPPITESDSVEEEIDAKVEETLAQPDRGVAADSAPPPRRWKRLMERARALFSPREEPLPPPPLAPAAPADPPSQPEPEAGESTTPETARGEVEPARAEVEPAPPPAPEIEAAPASPPEADTETEPSLDPDAILAAALESLGQAHHRPFSRA